MKSVKRTAFAFLASAMLISSTVQVNSVSAENSPRIVRVGLYYITSDKNTRLFSSYTSSASGFEIGFSNNSNFNKLFNLNSKNFVIAPSGNLFSKNSNPKNLYSGTGGSHTFGGYHVQLSGSFKNYSSAYSAASEYENAYVAYSGDIFVVRAGNYLSYDEAAKASKLYKNSTAVSPSKDGITLCDTANKKILFEYDNNKNRFALRAQKGGTVTLPTISGRSCNYYSYYGFFEYCTSGNRLNLINVIGLEQYVKGVMGSEIGTTASKEVTKAFSILVRTFACNHKHGSNFNVCNQTCCQVYRGTYRETAENNAIVDSTKGMILTYNGSIARCFYNYSNGGASCSSAAAWGSTPIPYLNSVPLDEAGKGVTWQKAFTKKELYSYLKSRPAFSSLKGGIASVKILKKDPQGSEYVTAFSVSDIYKNTVTVYNSSKIKTELGLASSNFEVNYTFNKLTQNADGIKPEYASSVITSDGIEKLDKMSKTYNVITADGITDSVTADRIVFDGKGRGHGVGFSQVGAEILVSQGYDYAYTLSFFFPGTVISKIK